MLAVKRCLFLHKRQPVDSVTHFLQCRLLVTARMDNRNDCRDQYLYQSCKYALMFTQFLVSLSQGWTPVSNRSSSGRWSVLSGSGGRHHRAHPPLHPGGGSQHLQCHVNEPQFRSAHTGAIDLASPPHQVNTAPEIPETHEDNWSDFYINTTTPSSLLVSS